MTSRTAVVTTIAPALRAAGGALRRARAAGSAALMLALAGCSSEGLDIQGRVTVDGKPLDSGTISLRSASVGGAASGAAVADGAFTLPATRRLPAGAYVASLVGFRRTGRTLADPQRGPVPETVQLAVADNEQPVEVTADNAANLQLEFHTTPGN